VMTQLVTNHCLDASGAGCAGDNTGVVVRTKSPVAGHDTRAPTQLCQVLAEDPSTVIDPNCSIASIGWQKLPPFPMLVNYADPQTNQLPHDATTRAAAVVSQILKREVETDGGLGVALGMAGRRLGGLGPLEIDVNSYCPYNGLQTSCQSGSQLLLEPAGLRAADITHFKYAIAHEFGHFVADTAMGSLDSDYGDGPGITGIDPMCQCAHVPTDEQGHCLQSLERPSAAQLEGFAQFFGAKVWNKDLEGDCTFVHGKNFLNTACMPGVQNCSANPNGVGMVNEYPIPVSCRQAVRWRNNHCFGSNATPDLLAHGTEYDWLEFYYAINNNAVPEERFSMSDIFGSYLDACGHSIPGNVLPCQSESVSWAGDAVGGGSHKSLVGGMNARFGATSTKASAFIRDGRAYGVSNQQ
jgi:hypothetical protein